MTLYADYSVLLDPTDVKRVGYAGAFRYLAWVPNPKVATAAEVAALRSLGLDWRLIWEYNADDVKAGAALGAQHGAEANRQANLLGYPRDGRPLYFAADYACPPADWPAVEAYLRAAGANCEWPPGLYGPRGVIEHMLSVGAAKAAWQAGGPTSWYGNAPDASGSNVSQVAHWYQRATPTLPNPGASVDENVQLRPDIATPAPVPAPPAPIPTPAPQEVLTDMHSTINPDGLLEVSGPAKDNGNLLVFTRHADGSWTVADVTGWVKEHNPADPRLYQVV